MKRFIYIALILAAGIQVLTAQPSRPDIDTFRKNILPQYRTYFNSAKVTETGQLNLVAADAYVSLTASGKSAVMETLVKTWPGSLIIVEAGTGRELWGTDNEAGKPVQVESWDINEKPVPEKPVEAPTKTALHPWFMYGGGQVQVNSQQNINMGFTGRTGFFLLMNRWDLAGTFSAFMMGNIESDAKSYQYSVGLMSKVYFPIQNLKISPNIGGEISLTAYDFSDTSSEAVTPYLLGGLSWFVGSGSFDIGLRAGKQTAVLLGYTFIPRLKQRN